MKNIVLALLGLSLSLPAWAQNIDDQKANVKQKYETQKDDENQAYDQRVMNAKDKYRDDLSKLNTVLDKLQADHNEKMEQLDNREKTALQKLGQGQP